MGKETGFHLLTMIPFSLPTACLLVHMYTCLLDEMMYIRL